MSGQPRRCSVKGELGRLPHALGEQPGDIEDRTGHPFVGPAGKLLNEALEVVGLDRRSISVTNAVKHFKREPRGKLRLHKNPQLEKWRTAVHRL